MTRADEPAPGPGGAAAVPGADAGASAPTSASGAARTRAGRRAAAEAATPEPPAAAPTPLTEPPSADVQLADEASPLPGAHRGGFSRLPTAPVGITTQSAPGEPDGGIAADARWRMPEPPPSRGIAGWALAFSVGGLIVSLFLGWGFPLGLVGAVSAIVALRRPIESRQAAVWALVLGILSIVYSAGWLLWAASQSALAG